MLVGGQTSSMTLPVTDDAPQVGLDNPPDGFLLKFDPTGKSILYGTYLGGSGPDRVSAIAVDSADNAYVTGQTGSPNFLATSDGAQTALAGPRNAFVAKIDFSQTVPILRPVLTQVVNYATGKPAVAPGTIITIVGERLAKGTAEAAQPLGPLSGSLPTALQGARATIPGRPVPLFSVSPDKIVAQLPYAAPAERTTPLTVSVDGIPSHPFQINVRSMAIGIMAVYKADMTSNSPSNQLTAGDVLVA